MSSNLVYVLSKVQFGEVTETAFRDAMDPLVDSLRKEYPIFDQKKEFRVFEVQVTPQGQDVVEQKLPMIALVSATGDWGVRITPQHALLQTKNYVSFEDFKSRMSDLLECLGANIPIYHTKFVGIRYVNKFEWDANTDFSSHFARLDFLQPTLKGAPSKAGSNLSCAYVTDAGVLSINSGVAVDQRIIPGDLLELAVDLNMANEQREGPWAHLDLDSFRNFDDMVEFSREDILSVLVELRACVKTIYQEIITPPVS